MVCRDCNEKIKIGDTISLKRAQSIEEDDDCLWKFGVENTFVTDCLSLVTFDRSGYFTLDLDERPFLLELGRLEVFKDSDYIYFGSKITFELVTMTQVEMELVYLW